VIFPVQIRAARGLLGLSQKELAEKSQLGVMTIKRLEAAGTEIRGSAQTFVRVQRALESLGIIFIEQDGAAGPGVRLKEPLP
jgi:transcriptional regulator with XRE-family HTH domain